MGNLAGWPYWKVISITGQSGAGTDYPVKLTIGDSAGGDFHLEGHCTNFPQDIRITDDDGTTLLDHFVEDLTADPLVVQVEVKDDLGSNRDIRVYYGKSGETSVSNISNTVIFGDDFPGSSIDTGKWTGDTGSATVSSGIMTLSSIGASKSIYSNIAGNIANSFALRSRTNVLDYSYTGFGFQPSGVSGRAVYMDWSPQIATVLTASQGWGSNSLYSLDVYHIFEIIYKPNVNSIFVVDGSTVATHSCDSPANQNANFQLGGVGTNTIQSDWILIRKYNSPEPAFSSAGAEQTPPTGVSPTGVFYGPLIGPLGGPI